VLSALLYASWILTAKQKLRVSISMELEGVTDVVPDDDYEYFFNVRAVLS
jgi:hypothetical protein